VNHSIEEIQHVEQQLQQAMLQSDVQALDQLLHDDLVFNFYTGTIAGKQEDLASHASHTTQFTEITFAEPPVIRLYGETAIVSVKTHLTLTFHGTPFAGFYRYLRVWHYQEERWQIVAGSISVVD
jgi:ketosteroid isomerase-like protein